MKFLEKIRFEIDNLNIRVADKLIEKREWKKYNPEHMDILDVFETLDFVVKLENALIKKRDKIKAYRTYLILQKIKEETGKEIRRPFELIKDKYKEIA